MTSTPTDGGTDEPGRADEPGGRSEGGGRPAPGALPVDNASGYPAEEIAAAWRRERPGTPVGSIGIVTPIWQLAKLLGDDRRRVLARAGIDSATLDLLSVLRRNGAPYELTTRELANRSLVTAGAVSQRVARAEREGLVVRSPGEGRPRTVRVALTEAGHALVEETVDQVLGRESELVAGLSEPQQAQLTELLRILLADVQARLGDDRITHVGAD
ncbi:MarR family winged helix-turn-helix transcriptional regulator [Streptomyces daliensis]|uniref:MarR family transcriptional regulator n=1 Tax=Streptomyces daliensis TaxID=299421 RepID=A0A8T4IP50_9ACTN|nr:MarR family transcriptional regulator [Streptomyces daliensis]